MEKQAAQPSIWRHLHLATGMLTSASMATNGRAPAAAAAASANEHNACQLHTRHQQRADSIMQRAERLIIRISIYRKVRVILVKVDTKKVINFPTLSFCILWLYYLKKCEKSYFNNFIHACVWISRLSLNKMDYNCRNASVSELLLQ